MRDETNYCPGCKRPDCSDPESHNIACQCRLDKHDPRRLNLRAMCDTWTDQFTEHSETTIYS